MIFNNIQSATPFATVQSRILASKTIIGTEKSFKCPFVFAYASGVNSCILICHFGRLSVGFDLSLLGIFATRRKFSQGAALETYFHIE